MLLIGDRRQEQAELPGQATAAEDSGDDDWSHIKSLDKHIMPGSGYVIVCKKDSTLRRTGESDAQTQVLGVPGEANA